MGYHQGVQKQNCLKWFFIRKRSGVFARKLQGIGREVAYHSSQNKIVFELECPIILVLSVWIIVEMFR